MSTIESVIKRNSYEPVKAIIFYNNGSKMYLQDHKIIKGEIRAGKPIKKETFKKFINATVEDNAVGIKRELINPDVLFHDGLDLIVWKEKAKAVEMLFSKNLNIENGYYPAPNLIFALKNKRDLYVWAVKTYDVKHDTEMYLPPFFNILSGQKVCLGSAKLNNEKKGSINELVETYSSLFWKSEFSAIHDGGGVSDNMNLFWKALKDKSKFPYKKLKPLNSYSNANFSSILNQVL